MVYQLFSTSEFNNIPLLIPKYERFNHKSSLKCHLYEYVCIYVFIFACTFGHYCGLGAALGTLC